MKHLVFCVVLSVTTGCSFFSADAAKLPEKTSARVATLAIAEGIKNASQACFDVGNRSPDEKDISAVDGSLVFIEQCMALIEPIKKANVVAANAVDRWTADSPIILRCSAFAASKGFLRLNSLLSKQGYIHSSMLEIVSILSAASAGAPPECDMDMIGWISPTADGG